jgi:hypothetical protein
MRVDAMNKIRISGGTHAAVLSVQQFQVLFLVLPSPPSPATTFPSLAPLHVSLFDAPLFGACGAYEQQIFVPFPKIKMVALQPLIS